ncbi:MAG: transglutaminase family protein [Deltaproteobacteria bacterium]|nr:transglutaminase family protein [Deltaproteobacteria bacterium]
MDDWLTPRRRYAALVERADEEIELERAAATIALIAYPDLAIETVIRQIQALADRVRGHVGATDDPQARRAALDRVLFADLGLRGNEADYYDPRNSFLNDVLDRRLGIPITLSVLYIAVGRRAGMDVEGVGFPGHFLVRILLGGGESVLVDPFAQGRDVSDRDLRALLSHIAGRDTSVPPEYLARSSTRDVLARVLGNLRGIYAGRGDAMKTLEVMEWLVLTHPGNATLKRDRGLLYYRLGSMAAAVADLRAYLFAIPAAEDRVTIEQVVKRALKSKPTVH